MGEPMRSFVSRCFAVAVLSALGLVRQSPAVAEELVKFDSAASGLPRAEGSRDGANLPRGGTEIRGYLTKPRGEGPFPAVVLLHSCLGLPADRQSIANVLARWGYLALFVDDFTTRGLRETCAVDFPEGLPDAFGALAFVARLPYVDKARIAVVGYSQGADTALQIASLRLPSGFMVPDDLRFAAAAAFYPPCANEARARLRLPTLILIGSADAVTPAADCEQLARNQPAADLKLVVYPGAGHVFDDPRFAGGKRILGMQLQFNEKAAVQSRSALRDFLAAKIGR